MKVKIMELKRLFYLLWSLVASGRGNADVLIHRSIFAGQMGFVL